MSELAQRFTIGYALAPKKENSFIQQSLLQQAKDRGIDLVRIDSEKPLISQAPFDCIIHKLYGKDWKEQLEQFSSSYPNVVIIDHPEAIERLHNRISMLEFVTQLEIPHETETFGIPKQIVIYNSEELFEPTAASIGGLKFPVIAKPLVADGSAKSHKMSLVFNHDGLKMLKPPIVLQEFVNHGGVIFKVYVVGEYVQCVKRKSLPDVSEEKLRTLEGSLSFSQVSNLTSPERSNNNKNFDMVDIENAEMPPLSFITDIAIGLRKAMGLNLFNFDVIRDVGVGNLYLVIDINYFPGYAKMPSYEPVLTDFFWNIVHRKQPGELSLGTQVTEESFDEAEKKLVSNTGCSDDGDGGVPSF